MSKLLVVEDNPDIALGLKLLFERAGHNVEHAQDGREGLRLVHKVRPDLVVLDIGLPIMDGWQVLERVRDISDVPVLLLTAHGQERDKVRGLHGGADDYLTKPFTNGELLARVTALLRRSSAPDWSEEIYDDGRLQLDPVRRSVTVDGESVHLTPIEFRLLNTLARHKGAVLSPSQLLSQVWDDPTGIGAERVKFAVLRLRRRLGWSDPSDSRSSRYEGWDTATARRRDSCTLVGMSMPATVAIGSTFDEWVNAATGPFERAEISNGEFVFRRVGGNPHHYVARRIADEFERQWAGVLASSPGHWGIELTPEGRVITGRFPDVLVDGESLVTDPVFVGVPHVVVEVWSPGNTLADMNAKRSEYRAAGAPVFVEVFLNDAGDVHLEWQVLEAGRWQFVAAAGGERELRVAGPRPFSVVPNDLLRRA